MSPTEKCHYCGKEYPAPVNLHHSEEECKGNDLQDQINELESTTIIWHCHHRLGRHEVGCSHREWSKEQLQDALESAKKSLAYRSSMLTANPKRRKKS